MVVVTLFSPWAPCGQVEASTDPAALGPSPRLLSSASVSAYLKDVIHSLQLVSNYMISKVNKKYNTTNVDVRECKANPNWS